MVATRQRGYKRAGPYIEICVPREADYDTLVSTAISELHVGPEVDSEDEEVDIPLSLFYGDGTVIPRKPDVKWTVGYYLSKSKRSPSQLKFGVGYLTVVSHTTVLCLKNSRRGYCFVMPNLGLMYMYLVCIFLAGPNKRRKLG